MNYNSGTDFLLPLKEVAADKRGGWKNRKPARVTEKTTYIAKIHVDADWIWYYSEPLLAPVSNRKSRLRNKASEADASVDAGIPSRRYRFWKHLLRPLQQKRTTAYYVTWLQCAQSHRQDMTMVLFWTGTYAIQTKDGIMESIRSTTNSW